MTLRELVQKAGGIDSPQMDYELDFHVEDKICCIFPQLKQVVNMDKEEGNPKVLLMELTNV